MENKINPNFSMLSEGEYIHSINTPSMSVLYFNNFHAPLVERALKRNDIHQISLVDIACGYAHELDFLKDNPNVNLFGVDISDIVLAEARKRLPNARLLQHDVQNGELHYDAASMDAVRLCRPFQ